MFCRHCGAKNGDTSIFCVNCGKKLSAAVEARNIKTPETSQQKPSAAASNSAHPYHDLGGWLAIVTYGMLIGQVLQMASVALADFALLKVVRYLGFGALLFAVVLTIAQLISFRLVWKFFGLVKEKNPAFFRYYENLSVLWIFIELLNAWNHSFSSDSIRSILWAVLIAAVWIAYFCKSVRVRTYFGTDAYLRDSHFFHDVKAPDPVD